MAKTVPEKLILVEKKSSGVKILRPFLGIPSKDKKVIKNLEDTTGSQHTLIDNVPTVGFKIVGHEAGTRSRNTSIKMKDPRGAHFMMCVGDFLELCSEVNINDSVIQDPCVYLSNNSIIPAESKSSKCLEEHFTKLEKFKKYLSTKRTTLRKSKSFDSLYKYCLPKYNEGNRTTEITLKKMVFIKKLKVSLEYKTAQPQGWGKAVKWDDSYTPDTFELDNCILTFNEKDMWIEADMPSSGWIRTDIEPFEGIDITTVQYPSPENSDELEYFLTKRLVNLSYEVRNLIKSKYEKSGERLDFFKVEVLSLEVLE